MTAANDNSSRKEKPTATGFTLCCCAGILACVIAATGQRLSGEVAADLRVATPVIQLLCVVLTVIYFRWPKSFVSRVGILGAHAYVATVSALLLPGHYDNVIAIMLAAGLRAIILSGWLLCLVGVCFLIQAVRHGRLRWHRLAPHAIRWLLATILVFVPVELTSLALEKPTQPIVFYKSVPPHADDADISIAAIGGSTMLGFPYNPNFGIANVAMCQLQHRFPDLRIELDNLANTGLDLACAIQQLNELQSMPDVLVVYSGHNEYFHELEELRSFESTYWPVVDDVLIYSPTFRVLGGHLNSRFAWAERKLQKDLCGSWLCPDVLERRRLQRYVDRIRNLMAWCKKNDVRAVFCVPAADEADFEPNSSVCRSTSEIAHEQTAAQWREVKSLGASGNWSQALTVCEHVLSTEPDFAEFHFLAGQCCRSLAEFKRAEAHFRMAMNLDQFPIRAKQAYRDSGKKAAESMGAIIIDCPEILRSQSKDGLLGRQFFLDGVHPNLSASFLVGTHVSDAIARELHLNERSGTDSLSFKQCTEKLGMTPSILSTAYKKTAIVFDKYSRLRWEPNNDRIRKSEQYDEWHQQLATGLLAPGEGGTESLTTPNY